VLLIGDILRRHAEYRGERLAYVIGDARVSYREMNRRANRVAHFLTATGVSRGDRVAILAGNIPLYPECYFACAKLGAILVPQNARWKADEIVYGVTQSASKVLFYGAEFAELALDLGPRLPSVERSAALDARQARPEIERQLGELGAVEQHLRRQIGRASCRERV